MYIKKVKFKNFRSYGNELVEFVISEDNILSSLNLIVGRNGAGKTTISQAIVYALYGKCEGLTQAQLCNRINKSSLSVEIDLDCDGNLINIKRTLKPASFEVTINNQPQDMAGKTNIQELLEESYYHIPYAVFKNLIILNINDFKSMLTLTPGEKSKIIDKIFGYSVLNEMAKFVKIDTTQAGLDLNNIQNEIKSVENSINVSTDKLKLLEKNVPIVNINELNQTIETLKSSINENNILVEKCIDASKKINEKLHNINIDNTTISNEILTYKKKIKLIDIGKCPLCGSDLTGGSFIEERALYVKNIKDLEDKLELNNSTINKMNNNNNKLSIKLNNIKLDTYKLSNILIEKTSDLKSTNTNNKVAIEQINDLILEFKTQNEKLQLTATSLNERYYMMQIITKIFSDNGVKKYIGSKYTPVINNIITEISHRIDIEYNMKFEDDFSCSITQCGIDVDYSTLSSGEKRKMDFTVIISFLKMLKLQYPGINTLFCDEIFATLSTDVIPDMVSILSDITKELQIHAYLIHHSIFDSSDFNTIYQISKKDGFSFINKI